MIRVAVRRKDFKRTVMLGSEAGARMRGSCATECKQGIIGLATIDSGAYAAAELVCTLAIVSNGGGFHRKQGVAIGAQSQPCQSRKDRQSAEDRGSDHAPGMSDGITAKEDQWPTTDSGCLLAIPARRDSRRFARAEAVTDPTGHKIA